MSSFRSCDFIKSNRNTLWAISLERFYRKNFLTVASFLKWPDWSQPGRRQNIFWEYDCRGMCFFGGAAVVVFSDVFNIHFLHKNRINALSTAICGTYFDYVSAGLIWLSLHVEIFLLRALLWYQDSEGMLIDCCGASIFSKNDNNSYETTIISKLCSVFQNLIWTQFHPNCNNATVLYLFVLAVCFTFWH